MDQWFWVSGVQTFISGLGPGKQDAIENHRDIIIWLIIQWIIWIARQIAGTSLIKKILEFWSLGLPVSLETPYILY